MKVRIVVPKPRKSKWYEPVRIEATPRVLLLLDGVPASVSLAALDGCTAEVRKYRIAPPKGGRFMDMMLLELLDGELSGGLYWAPVGSKFLEVMEADDVQS